MFLFRRSKYFYFAKANVSISPKLAYVSMANDLSLCLYGANFSNMSLWRVSAKLWRKLRRHYDENCINWNGLTVSPLSSRLSSLVSQLALVSRLALVSWLGSLLALVSRLGLASPHRRNSKKWVLLTFFWGRRGLALGDSATRRLGDFSDVAATFCLQRLSASLPARGEFRRASLLAATFFKHSSSSGTQAFWRRRDQLSDVEVRLLSVSRDVVVSDC